MGLPSVERFRARCEQTELTDQNTRWVLTHFSHAGGACYAELVDIAAPLGFDIAFDGMEVDLSAHSPLTQRT
jgi:phosphoribosyl 1,2-cyclic phosphate phosphodiesterase